MTKYVVTRNQVARAAYERNGAGIHVGRRVTDRQAIAAELAAMAPEESDIEEPRSMLTDRGSSRFAGPLKADRLVPTGDTLRIVLAI